MKWNEIFRHKLKIFAWKRNPRKRKHSAYWGERRQYWRHIVPAQNKEIKWIILWLRRLNSLTDASTRVRCWTKTSKTTDATNQMNFPLESRHLQSNKSNPKIDGTAKQNPIASVCFKTTELTKLKQINQNIFNYSNTHLY